MNEPSTHDPLPAADATFDTSGQPLLANAVGLYMDGIRDGNPRDAIARYTGARYTQHSTGVRDGREGFIEFFEDFLERTPERDIRVVRGWQDGRHMFVHVYQSLNGGESRWITTDFFDTDEAGKIIEHWDVIAAYEPKTASGRTSIDGPSEVTDLDKTESNKAIVREAITQLLMRGGDVSEPERFISAESYLQHSAQMPDGLDAFAKALRDPQRDLWYERIVLMVGRGNFVATLCEATRNGERMAQVDVLRLENGLIVEHWDNVEPCPAPGEDVNGGKF